jgi:hypothetical protein
MAGRPTRNKARATPTGDKAVLLAYKAIDHKRHRPWHGEEEVRLIWVSSLEAATGFDFDAERRKLDSSFNNVVIEFKAPGLFNGKKSSTAFKEAMNKRLLPYIQKSSERLGIPEADFIGVATDGEHVCFAQVVDGVIRHGHMLPFSEQSFGMVVAACQNSTRPAVSSENLIKDFGHTSPVATAVMQVLSNALGVALKSKAASKLRMLFEEWADLYGQVADMSVDQAASIDKSLRFTWKGPAPHSMAGRLFVIHTYNSLLIKLLAAEIVSAHNLTTILAPAEAMCALFTPAQLINELDQNIERGGLFAGSGIHGFVEEAIFSWHLDVARSPVHQKGMVSALKAMLGKLALYRTDHLTRQRDTLRDFYQDLVPETLRKSLGEFYTPDWLVDFTVSQAAPGKILGKRFLDPTCGSGSFLIEVIRRKRNEAAKSGLTARQTLTALCGEVWGFDLNPLAVQTARVNFLMEIADLLAQAKGMAIELPVLLADAIYSPAPDPAGNAPVVEYKIGSQVASLTILLPTDLAFNRVRLDVVFEAMGEHVERDQEFVVVLRDLIRAGALTKGEAKAWDKPLRATYEQVLKLHRKNWNGIWFRIVRNFFWSATAGKFDVIVGNPPWVRWSRLPDAYRDRVKPTCEQYDIFSRTNFYGGNELDISAMITYTTGDKWLKEGGKLAFVITQALFQNPSSAGFRNFRINDSGNLVPLRVDDLKALKPFPDAANKTAVAVFEKTMKVPVYPVAYTVWDAKKGETRTINPDLTLDSVLKKVQRSTLEASPVGGSGSPWAILPVGRFADLVPMSTPTEEPWVEGRKGITVDLNGVYFVRVLDVNEEDRTVQIQSRPEAGKKAIGPVQTRFVESDWLYPLIKGAGDFEACYLKPVDLFAIVPNKGIRQADFAATEVEWQSMKRMKKYLGGFDHLLVERSTWKGRMKAANAPHYAIYNVGEFTFKPWKVIWAEMSGSFSAAVAGLASVPFQGLRPYVPDHKIFFVAMDDKTEAHYLCGILNSGTVAEYVESHNVAIQIGNIFKHMRLPEFDAKNKDHLKLAKLVETAHGQHDPIKRKSTVYQASVAADKLTDDWLKTVK